MRRSCKEDERIHKILYKKLEILDVVTFKTSEVDINRQFKKVLKEKTNEIANEKKLDKMGHTWIN
jgi:hypothetical protein